MRDIHTLWFDVAVVSTLFALGHIFFGHFEERTSRKRKIMKYIITMILFLLLSIYFGRVVPLTVMGVMILFVLYVHAIVLPKKGINGWTGEPKEKYYDFRGWDKDIFKVKKVK